MPTTINLAQKQKLARKAEPFILKEGIMYRVGQDNGMCRCLTTLQALIVLKELHEKMVGGYFAANIIAKKILNAGYWWLILFKDTHDICKSYDNCQKIGGLKTKSLARLVITLPKETFMKWDLDFISPLKLARRLT
jgi:hypothetical protein